MRRDIVHFTTKARWIRCVSVTIILPTILGYDVQLTIGLYRENAIAIQNESGDSNGGNV